MKYIKIAAFILGLIVFAATVHIGVPKTYAQNADKKLVVTPIERGQNLSFFFDNSEIPVEFFETEDAPPVFISIVTPSQIDMYKKAGYDPVVVDEKAGDIDQYYLLYGKRKHTDNLYQLLQDDLQGKGLELAYPVTKYTVLVKVADGLDFKQLNIPDLQRGKPRQLIGAITPPPTRTQKATAVAVQTSKGPNAVTIALSTLVILAVIVLYGVQVKRAEQ